MRGMTNYADMQEGAGSLGQSRPLSLRHLFWAFTWMAMQGFGGILAVAQRELVEKRRWMTQEQFLEEWSVAQVLPGANVVNLALMLGDRYFGWRGGLVALAGLLSFPLLLVLLLAVLFAGVADQPQVQGAMRGMGAVAAGMIAAAGLKMLPSLKNNVLPGYARVLLIGLTFAAVALLRVRLIWVLLVLGGLGALWAYRLLGQRNGPGKGNSPGKNHDKGQP